MKNQALISSKDKSNKLKCCLLQFLYGALRVNPTELRTAKSLWSFCRLEYNRVKRLNTI